MENDIDISKLTEEKPTGSHIMERTLHTITTMMIYPNGSMFVKKTISWLDKQQPVVKKKKAEPRKAIKSVLQDAEEH